MTVGKKISAGFGIILLILVGIVIANYSGVGHIIGRAAEVINGSKLDALLAQKEVDHLNWVAKVNAFLTDEKVTELNVETDYHKCGFGKWYYSEERKEAERQVPSLAPLLKAIEQPHIDLHESAVVIQENAARHGEGRAQARVIYNTKSLPALHAVQEQLNKIRAEGRKNIQTDAAMLSSARHTRILVTTLGIAVLIFGAVVAFFMSRGISKLLQGVVHQMSEGAHQVAEAAAQISSSSQAMAEGASEQAASVEETSASLEEISAMTRQDADNTHQADTLMKEAKEVLLQADASMEKLTRSMQEISAASSETQKIVKTIDEIAFQTNLLALNAAVEAARAGEAGAGFAVVAGEVRNLAMRAAQAAKNTSTLIDSTVKKVKGGSALVDETSGSFHVASDSVQRVSVLLSEIATSSSEQARAMGQVSSAINQIDTVTQRNAATSEQTASASEQLSAQAEVMKGAVQEMVCLVMGQGAGATKTAGTAAEKTTAKSAAKSAAKSVTRVTAVGAGKTKTALASPAKKAGVKKSLPPGRTATGSAVAVKKETAAPVNPAAVIPLDDEDFKDF